MQPYELLDHDCPQAIALVEAVEAEIAVESLGGEEGFLATLAKLNPRAVEHKTSCARCRAFKPHSTPRSNGSAVWGGGTLGLFVGLVVGVFRHNYWETVLISVAIGTLLGIAANALAWRAARFAR